MLFKLVPEVKAQWTAALRSGEYQQGKYRLERDGKFCCLGVLCRLAVAAGVEVRVEPTNHPQGSTAYNDALYYPPDEVLAWAGIDPSLARANNLAVHTTDGRTVALTTLNDGDDLLLGEQSFRDIADLIDASL